MSGPEYGTINVASSPFSIILDNPAPAGGVTCTISAPNSEITSTPVVISSGMSFGIFTITPGTTGDITITLASTSPSLTILGSPIVYHSAAVGEASSYTFTGPASAPINNTSAQFTITPTTTPVLQSNGSYTNPGSYVGTITIADSRGGSTQYTFDGSTSQSFTVTATGTAGSSFVLTPTSDPALADPPALTVIARTLQSINPGSISSAYSLSSQDTYYKLTGDVTSLGTAFAIAAHHVTLDLNGHTVIYDNDTPCVVPNGGFDTGDFTNWNVSGASDASVVPTILGLYGNYCAQLTQYSTTQTLISSPFYLPAANVPYRISLVTSTPPVDNLANLPTVAISLIDDVTQSVLLSQSWQPHNGGVTTSTSTYTPSSVANQCVFKIVVTPSGQEIANDTIQLDYAAVIRDSVYGIDNRYYHDTHVLSSVPQGNGATAGTITISDGAITAIALGTAGAGYATAPLVFINNGMNANGSTGMGAEATASIDENGNVTGFTVTSGGTAYTNAIVSLLSGGKIVQGQARSGQSHPFYDYSAARTVLDGVGLFSWGMDVDPFHQEYGDSPTITNCEFVSITDVITSRMKAHSFVAIGATGPITIINNRCSGQHQNGIVVNSDLLSSSSASILFNDVRQNSSWTDGYGIGLQMVHNFDVAYNTIIPVSGRGIMLQAEYTNGQDMSDHDGSIHDNYVDVQEHGNLEYGPGGLAATAMRFRDYEGTVTNIHYYNNTFYAHVDAGEDNTAIAARFTWWNDDGRSTNSNMIFENNYCKAIVRAVDPNATYQDAYALDIAGMFPGDILPLFRGNTFESNDISINFGSSDGSNAAGIPMNITFVGNTLVKSTEGITTIHSNDNSVRGYVSIEAGGYGGSVLDVKFVDQNYSGGASFAPKLISTGAKLYTTGWLMDVTVQHNSVAVPNATVTVTDGASTVQYTGTTDANGQCLNIPVSTMSYSSDGSSGQNTTPESTSLNNITVSASTTSPDPAYSGSHAPINMTTNLIGANAVIVAIS